MWSPLLRHKEMKARRIHAPKGIKWVKLFFSTLSILLYVHILVSEWEEKNEINIDLLAS